MVLTLNFKVVGNQVDWTAGHHRMGRLLRGRPEAARVVARRVAASLVLPGCGSSGVSAATTTLGVHWVVALRRLSLRVVHLLCMAKLLLRRSHVPGVGARVLRSVQVWLVVSVVCVLELVGLH